jgi:DNA primase
MLNGSACLFDGDNAGRKATVRAMELCLEQALPVYVVSLPQGEDPDSFLQKTWRRCIQQRVASAKPAFEQFLHWLLAKTPADSVDQRVRLMDEIIPRFQRIKDPVEKDLYQKEICRLLGIDLQAFRNVWQVNVTTSSRRNIRHATRPAPASYNKRYGVTQLRKPYWAYWQPILKHGWRSEGLICCSFLTSSTCRWPRHYLMQGLMIRKPQSGGCASSA